MTDSDIIEIGWIVLKNYVTYVSLAGAIFGGTSPMVQDNDLPFDAPICVRIIDIFPRVITSAIVGAIIAPFSPLIYLYGGVPPPSPPLGRSSPGVSPGVFPPPPKN